MEKLGCNHGKGLITSALSHCQPRTFCDLQNYLSLLGIIPPPTQGNTNIRVTFSSEDYQDVELEDDSVLLCDIPYINTEKYVGQGREFDYERFYAWCMEQTQPLFICSYEMPLSDFRIIAEFTRYDTMRATKNRFLVTERVFIPRTQENIVKV